MVAPRLGTVSPWASKATDIAHNCGLQSIQRLERGIAYYVAGNINDADAQAIAGALRPGQTLLMGLARGEPDLTAPEGARYYNSLFALADEGGAGLRVAAVYDKHRLVPFGEYLPLGSLMTSIGLRSLVHMPSDFSAGPTPAPISIPGAPPDRQSVV